MQTLSRLESRLESFFPFQSGDPAAVLLVNPAAESSEPPLDLLKLSAFLKKRGYRPSLTNGDVDPTSSQPRAVVLTAVFSWDVPAVRRVLAQVRSKWPGSRRILTGVLPRKFGDSLQSTFDVSVLDERSETLLDNETPDYSLVPQWDASIVITSRGVCPRECSHCETAAQGKKVTKLMTDWGSQLKPELPRIEVWDNTLMLTSRDHLSSVAYALKQTSKPVDFVCGLTPGGVDEAELCWRIKELAELSVMPARLECNGLEYLPRFIRLLDQTRKVFGDTTCYRAFAVINGTEAPTEAKERIRLMEAEDVAVDIVPFTPHEWEEPQQYVNASFGWTAADIGELTHGHR